MEEFIKQMTLLNNNIKSTFIVCGIFIIMDVFTGYLKAFKMRRTNSSVSRDGYIKKAGWLVSLILGFLVDLFIGTGIFLNTTAVVLIATEGISVYENLGEIGIELPFKEYFENLKDNKLDEKDKK